MALTFTRIGSAYNVFGANANQGVAQLSVKNTDTSNAVKLKSITINGIYYIYDTTWVNNNTDSVAIDKATGKMGTWTTSQYGGNTTAITVKLSIYDASSTTKNSDVISLGSSSASKTFTFSDPPILAANTTYNITFTYGGNYTVNYWVPSDASYLQSGETSTEIWYARAHHFSMIALPAAGSVSGVSESAAKSIKLTVGTGVSSATATGGTTGSKTFTSSQTFAGVAWNGNVKLTARTLATGYHDGTNTTVNKTFTADATLNAVANTYTVNYYDGSTKKGSSSHTYGTAKALNTASSMSMSKDNWSFYGWTTSTTATSRDYADGASVSNLTSSNEGTVTLYAIWRRSASFWSGIKYATEKTAYVYYNSKGGNYSVTIPSGTATIDGWTLLGWRNDSTASTSETSSTTGTITLAPYSNGDTFGYGAVYSRTLTLSYTGNGNTGGSAPSNSTSTQYYNSGWNKISSGSFTLRSNTFSRTGYTFNGWAAGSEGATYTWTPSVSASATTSTAAQWKGISYTVAFNKNGGSGTTMTSLSCTYGTAKALTANSYTAPSGYTFGGWATSVANATAGTVAYADKANITTGTTTAGGTVTLYAIWYKNITFYHGSSKAKNTVVKQYYDSANSKGANITTPTAATCTDISGWTELGWRDDTDAGAKEYNFGASIFPSVTTYYAVYSRDATFYSGKNKATTDTKTQYYNTNGAYTVTSPAGTAITGWTKLGFRNDTTAGAKEYSVSSAITASSATYYAVYSRSVTLSYTGNNNTGGSAPTAGSATQYYNSNDSVSSVSFTLATNTFSRTGYTFNGWSVGAAGATYTTTPAYSTTGAQALSTSATWVGITYYVAYYNDGTDLKKNSTHTYGTGKALTTASTLGISKSGYTFYGWATADKSLTRSYTDGQSVSTLTSSSGGTVKLYAIWYKTCHFYSGASKGTDKTATLLYNNTTSSVSIPATPADISNWTPLGWRDDTTAGVKEYDKTGAITSNTSDNFYAVYSRTLTVSYNGNNSTSGSTSSTTATIYLNSNSTTTSSQKITTASNGFSRTGYTFNKWNTKADASGTAITAGNDYTPSVAYNASTFGSTLYATWAGISYTVKFNANGGTGSMSDLSCTYGTAKELTANAFTAPAYGGYAFAGWATSVANATAGTVAYANQANITTGTSTSGGTVTLYAIWKRTVTFYSGKSKATTNTATQYYGGTVTLPTLTAISSWSTLGYRTDTTASTADYSTGSQSYTGINTLYAVYSRTITLTYANGGGTGTAPSNTTGTQYYNTNGAVSSVSLKLASNTFNKTGYTFSKWTDGNASATISKNPAVDASASFTETAQWTINSYTVSYNANGGTSTPTQQSGNYNTSITLAGAITKNSDVTYTVTFDKNNSSAPAAPAAMSSSNKYTFDKWALGSATSSTTYSAKASYTIPASNSTMYATWTTTAPSAITLPSMEGFWAGNKRYAFVGWSTSSSGSVTNKGGTSYTPTKNITLYAVWSDDQVIVTFDANGGSGTMSSQTIYRGAAIDWPTTIPFTRSNYKQIGWNTKSDGTGIKYLLKSTEVDTMDALTLYAIWYPMFYWTTSDNTYIKAGDPVANATAAKWTNLESKIKSYISSSYTASTITAGSPMIASKFKTAAEAVSSSAKTQTAGNLISASDFTAIKTALNDNATYLGAK